MRIKKRHQTLLRHLLVGLLLINSAMAADLENGKGKGKDGAGVLLLRTQHKGSELQLEVRQASLSQVLEKIVTGTGVRIHYSVLPEGLITATCVGSTLKEVLACLFDRKADLVFRYPPSASNVNNRDKPEEIWVLGTDFGSVHLQSANCTQAVIQEKVSVPIQSEITDIEQSKPETTDKLIEMSKAKDPADRANAISQLGIKGEVDNADIRQTLAAALSDNNAEVRAQAVNSLARREGESASKELQEALLDHDSSVRLMVVDNAGNNSALLQQALADSDETVRTYAAMKLEELSK